MAHVAPINPTTEVLQSAGIPHHPPQGLRAQLDWRCAPGSVSTYTFPDMPATLPRLFRDFCCGMHLHHSDWYCHHDFNVGARCFCLILLCSGPLVVLNIQLSWETTVVPRPRTKRAALIAIASSISSISHWFSPYFFLRSQRPRYQMCGGIVTAGCGLTVFPCVLA